jgi:hypothetical protein
MAYICNNYIGPGKDKNYENNTTLSDQHNVVLTTGILSAQSNEVPLKSLVH